MGDIVYQTVSITVAAVGHGNVDVFPQHLVDAVALLTVT